MRNSLLLPLSLLICAHLPAQNGKDAMASAPARPKVLSIFHKLGDEQVRINTIQYGASNTPTFINLHDDEATSVNAARRLLEKKGGLLIRIANKGKRNIRFKLDGRIYTFDPNRIFSREGIIQTLTTHGNSSKRAIAELEKFARRILALVPENPTCIVALHNNTNGKFSINSYLPGSARENDARQVFAVDTQDDDDIFLTTDSLLFQHLVKENFNAVWQDNQRARKDGSLSIYFGEKNIAYLNCETEHGKIRQYESMIMAAAKYFYETPQPDLYSNENRNSLAAIDSLLVREKNYELSSAEDYAFSSSCFPGKKTTGHFLQRYRRAEKIDY